MIISTLKSKEFFTVKQAALKFDKTTGRIRQICRKHEFGVVIENRLRLLSPSDMRDIARILRKIGRDFSGKNSEKN